MEEIVKTALGQCPSLCVLYLLVTMFLRRDKERDTFIGQLHGEHLAARGESREAIKENTESNRAVTHAIESLSMAVRSNTSRKNE
jgi:hypothetical protein